MAEVGIDKLRSMRKHRYRQEYITQGFMIFNLPVRETPHFQFIKNYQNNSKLKFKSTPFWKLVDIALATHRSKTSKPYVRNRGGVVQSPDNQCARFIQIYEKIKLEGKFEPIRVVLMHDGKYVIKDGLHRAAVACALGYKKVPAVISISKKVLLLMNTLKNMYPESTKEVLYIPIDHLIFNNWKVLRDDTRWKFIENEYNWKGKKVLDIGSYTGYFSHKVAKLGGKVIGIETDKKRLTQSILINNLLESNVEFIRANFFSYLKDKKFDCILFFSVLHWVLKREGVNGFNKALDVISSSSPVMFLDMGQDHESKVNLKNWNHGLVINKSTIPDLVISNSKYKHCDHLGVGDTGRDVFKFSR